MNEHRARRVVAERAAGRCELCGKPGTLDFAHRVARGQGGLWTPSNGLALCGPGNAAGCHGWTHRNPGHAHIGGWIVPGGGDAATVPVYLRNPFPWWWLLDNEGIYHLIHHEDHDLPAVPELPPAVAA